MPISKISSQIKPSEYLNRGQASARSRAWCQVEQVWNTLTLSTKERQLNILPRITSGVFSHNAILLSSQSAQPEIRKDVRVLMASSFVAGFGMNRMNMMEQVHLAGEDEDDIYGGFNDYNATLDVDDLQHDSTFQKAVLRTSHGRRPPPTAARGLGGVPGTAARGGRMGMPSSMGRIGTAAGGGGQDMARPMTAVRGAGYTSAGNRAAGFDPMNQAGPAPPLEPKPEESPEEKIRQLEKKVNELIEESCFANSTGDLSLALEKAKEAGRKERVLVRQREQQSMGDQINLDLTYSVLFNLANQYAANEMFNEALNTYQVIVKNKMFTNAGRLKVNMGNIYFRQRNYPKAIKFYRMALDQVPNSHKEMRTKIMQNVGIVFVKMGQYNDAITSFEHIMQEAPNFKTGFNLILCYFALGDREKMKRGFQKLLTVDLRIDDEDKYLPHGEDKNYNLILEVIKNDALRQIERKSIVTDLGFVFTDASYSDPLGPQMERPKTAAARKQDNDDLFDEDVGDDLLPE
uniref:Intraflagellar transport protein 88 homolog n=1 Tax=Magallana gigas TaxID=29159 RepID=K1QZL1_MAGGI